MRKVAFFGAIAAVAVVTTALYAEVIFDPGTGEGFVGKGDVQLQFGWNNKAIQDRHESITFEYDDVVTYEVECEWYTGPDHNRTKHTLTRERTSGVLGELASESRRTGQWTGWHLLGFESRTSTGAVPAVGDPCLGTGVEGVVSSVEETGSGDGGLYAVYQGDRRLLPQE
jgi:hypothetical protein